MQDFLKKKTVAGFCVPAMSVLLSIIMVIVYTAGFSGTIYLSGLVIALPLAASVLFLMLSLLNVTTPFAAPIAGLIQFVALLLFIWTSYLYLPEPFYAGVSWAAFASMNKAWPVTLILLLANVVLCNIGFYKKQERGEVA